MLGRAQRQASLGIVEPGKNFYPVEQQVSNELAIRSDPLTGEDLFVIVDEMRTATGASSFKVLVKPLVNLIWLAGLVFVAGVARSRSGRIPREERRLASRRHAAAPPRMTTSLALALAALLAALVLCVARPFLREPVAKPDRLSEPDELERRRLALLEERDRALAALQASSSSTTARARSPTRTTARSSGRCAGGPRRRCVRSSRAGKGGNVPGQPANCSNCGTRLPAGARFCALCGTTVENGDTVRADVPPHETRPAPVVAQRRRRAGSGLRRRRCCSRSPSSCS